MKKLIVFLAFSLIGLTLSFAQSSSRRTKPQEIKPHYILIDIYEVESYEQKGIHIHYNEGNTDYIPFKTFKKENHDDNNELLTKTLNELYDDGYRIVEMSSGAWNSGKITKIVMEYKK